MADPKSSPVQPYTEGTQTVGARLSSFASGSADLGGAHKSWLSNYFGPQIKKSPNAWVDLIAYSSPSGSAAANTAICNKRIEAVERYIKSVAPSLKINVKEAKGSAEAKSFNMNTPVMDSYWRAVLVRWWGVTSPIDVPLYSAEVPDWMKRVYKLIPTAEVWRAAAERVLTSAEMGLRAQLPSPEQLKAMDLVDRVFQITRAPGQTDAQSLLDLQHIKNNFIQMGLLIQAIKRGDLYLHESVDPAQENAIAYTYPGNWANKSPADGIWYVRKKIEPATDEFVVDATIHEFAHFCGPKGANHVGHAKVGGKSAYGLLALGLQKADAMKNASSYAWLAYLARKPSTVWLTAT